MDITTQLENGKILPLVFRLTVPAVIAQLITFLYNIVDRMYVSRIQGSGMAVHRARELSWVRTTAPKLTEYLILHL